jgi:tetratricopeptide (TPR) repeat protein
MKFKNKYLLIIILVIKNPLLFGFQEQPFSLEGIQHSIYEAFLETIKHDDPNPLLKIGENLHTLGEERDLNIIKYWKSYNAYYTALYYTSSDKEKAEDLIDEHIKLMESIDKHTADDLAMLSLIRSYSIQFKSGINAIFISGKVNKDLDKALEMEPNNTRVMYVKASSDYYTPEKYGGGTQVEKLLTQVINTNNEAFINPILPTWGKREAYELLLQWHIRKKEKEKAIALLEQALIFSPNNKRIVRLGNIIGEM